jgi:DNA-binding MarR family transcriptional regulator
MVQMIHTPDSRFLTPTKELRRLSILLAIQGDTEVSQHKIAQVAHLSSSMVNIYIKELQQENLITITGHTNRTQRYHLTSSGQSELMNLLLSYSAEIIQIYGATKREIAKKLNSTAQGAIRTLALFGAAETAEVVHAAIQDTPFSITAVVDSDRAKQGKRFNGFRIQPPEFLHEHAVDAIVITSFGRQEEIFLEIRKLLGDAIRVIKLSEL